MFLGRMEEQWEVSENEVNPLSSLWTHRRQAKGAMLIVWRHRKLALSPLEREREWQRENERHVDREGIDLLRSRLLLC